MGLRRDTPIFLTGFMATGKSKVGLILAGQMGRMFVDTDEMVVVSAGKSIPSIFEEDGEGAFRQWEHEAILGASRMENVMVSLGGGAIAHARNWDVIRSTGVCLCFTASVETIFERVSRKRHERPLLAGLDDTGLENKIRTMLAEREAFYRQADVFVDSSEGRTPEETAELARAALERCQVDGDGRPGVNQRKG
jgi:shikimate kinase